MDPQEKCKKVDVYAISTEPTPNKVVDPTKTFWHIDKEMLYFKLHFFLFMGALSMVLPFISVFAKVRLGISASSLASVLMMEQFLFIVTKPILGYLADYFNKLKTIICLLTIFQAIFFFLLLIIPKIENPQNERAFEISSELINAIIKSESHQYSGNSSKEDGQYYSSKDDFFYVSPNNTDLESSDECTVYSVKSNHSGTSENNSKRSLLWTSLNDTKNINALQNKSSSFSMCKIFRNSTGHCYLVPCEFLTDLTETQNINDFYTYQFWLFALFTSAGMTCTSALFTLSDTACCESIQKTGAEFGRQRLWGAISWGVICPIGGLLNDYTDDYLASWILMAIMSALTLWNISKLDLLKPQFSQNILKDFGRVFKSKEFLIFEFAVLLNGIATGFVWFYLMLFLITIGGSRFLLGIAQTVQCFGGNPCMFFSGWLINKLGHFNVLTLSLLCYCIRFVWYSFLQDPWLVLPVECLHGITYGMLYTAVASYAKLNAKPGTEATTQSVLFTTHEGLGAGLGCVLAGIGFDLLGGHETFFRASLFSGCGAVVSIFLHMCARRAGGSITVTPPSDP